MSHRFTALFTHLVFSTKDRFPHLDTDLRGECFAYLGGILENIGARRIAIGGVSDHVHLLIDLPVTRPIAEVVRAVKANSSKWIHEKWPRRSKFAWQKGYAAFSVSRSSVDRVVRYIQNQERHHRRMTYQDALGCVDVAAPPLDARFGGVPSVYTLGYLDSAAPRLDYDTGLAGFQAP
jgi:putative transposase